MENERKELKMSEIVVGIVGIIVTAISIIVTAVSIIQSASQRKHQKNNRPSSQD